MVVATGYRATTDYLNRVRRLPGVVEVRTADQCGRLTFYTLVNITDEEINRVYDVELAIRDAHPDTPFAFRVYNLATSDPASVRAHFPAEAEPIYTSAK